MTTETFTGLGLLHADWRSSGNWSGAMVPGAGTIALVNMADVWIDPQTNLSANIVLENGAALIGNGGGFAFTPMASLQIDDENALFANGAIVNQGVISVASPSASLTIVVQAGSDIAASYGLTVPSFENTGSIYVQNDGTLNITGTELSNIGSINVANATLTVIAGWVDGGQDRVGSGGIIELDSGAVASFNEGVDNQTFIFTGPATLALQDGLDVANVSISGFNNGDEIVTSSVDAAESLLAGGLLFSSLPLNETLAVQATSFGAVIGLAVTSHSVLQDTAPCFARGTKILTVAGYVPVENLQPGDLLVTHYGRLSPLRWAGWRTIDLASHTRPDAVRPICVTAGALAENVPSHDLLLSPDHGLFLQGLLIPVKLLVNNLTIKRDTTRLTVSYFHLELDRHSVIIAENLPVETYLDTGNRGSFFNHAGQPWASPVFGRGKQHDVQVVADLCLKGPILRRVRQEIYQRALRRGGVPLQATAVTLRSHGQEILHSTGSVAHPGYRLPPLHKGQIQIHSARFVPAEMSDGSSWEDDYRSLGIAIQRVKLDFKFVDVCEIAQAGFYTRGNGDMADWTNGDGMIVVPQETKFIGLHIQAFPLVWPHAI